MSSSASVMSSSPTVRIVLQQCLSARLMVKPASGQQDDAEYVQVHCENMMRIMFFIN